ncbi:axonemal dynein light chain domain-containing protein 1 [Pantherophis guttatus]|uniref:Axonemal dynein light chain domain-containing protein 1 n=1 Tax=Pantherophis guttatus TaxID=94885 RepID=A0A6P9B3R1_PANGU|nr:axonemal dynein light chain domain-containing protein 1 [Pantherophis guttatus]XP_034265596.1 axonemal dynein light chain domain-containing protein 1 [Pantherophis guttatus]XP_034265597.1 axonemal dynein light chain domain-containing protein 1 [Pantherophis guttatus]XP_034265598.1 axonemal dynein light chain domain-containing protein 1 [Pantherophis guttatus]XP_034265599.1 axonemal dynein light chain domain-containing protein 1 [Pantherophis guttatus]XP_034265600.1 axonemal dynein light cha
MSDQREQVPALPSTSKEESKQVKDINSLLLISDSSKEFPELRDKPTVEVYSKSHSKPLQRDFIPEEIFVALTSAANPVQYPPFLKPPKKTKSFDFQGCIRTADGVWQHPIRRNKFRYLIQHPICLTGAGRDVSFLYDIISQKGSRVPTSGAVPDKSLKHDANAAKPAANVADSFVPEEFHIVKNRSVLGLEYYDDKYTTLLEDEENRLRVFPSMKPSGRLEVLQLMKVMDTMLEKAGTNDENVGVTGLSQMHNILEVMKVEQNIYNIVFHEIIRQVSVDCAERGELLSKLRQRYVELLERIPRQMRTLYREMMAQRVMDKHITDELFHFKQAIGQLTRELNTIREHDHRTTFEAEKAYQELAKAVRESEMNANLLDEYRELYELQRARLEAQIHQLTLEKELWSTATYDIALKVVEKNKLILARRMYDSEKVWVKEMRHFIMLLASQDSTDLSNLQHWTQEFRQLLRETDVQVDQVEEITRERTRSIQNGLTGWLNYFQNHVLGKGTYHFEKGATLLEQILVDLKVWEKMLNDELSQYGGDVLLLRQEPLKMATKLQKQWVDLGVALHGRHKDLQGRRPVESKMLEEINKDCSHLIEQYCTRVNGENGSAKIVITLLNSLEEWTFKLLSSKQKTGLYEADWINFFQAVSDWLAQLEDLLKITGSPETLQERKLKTFAPRPVIPEDVFKKIQNWLLTTTNSSERENNQLSRELTDFHNILSKWMVNLLMHMVPEHTCPDTIPLSDIEISMQAQRKMLNTLNLEKEVMGLAAQMSQFSSYLVSCCKEMVSIRTRKKLAISDPDAEHELQQLEKIKTECLDWIETCNLLLSGMKTSPTKLIDKKELMHYFGSEVFQPKRKLPPHPEHTLESTSSTQAEEIPDEVKKMEKAGSEQSPEKEPILEIKEKPSVPGTSSEIADESPEIDYQMRYIAHDDNVYCKTLTTEKISVSGRELYASQPTTEFSKKEFQILASLEILEERLIDAEKRAQEAEEKSETLHEELEEALKKLQDMEDEEPEFKDFGKKAEKSEKETSRKKASDKAGLSKPSTPRPKKSPKPKR